MRNEKTSKANSIVKVFYRFREALVRSIVKMSVKPEDVDDILQETFIRTYTADQKKTIDSPQDYFFIVSRNLVIRNAARRNREISAVIDDVLLEVSEKSMDNEIYEQIKCETLAEVIQSLPEKKRQAMLLRKIYGFSTHEIAQKMAVSKSSVDKYIAGAIKECEQKLRAKGFGSDSQQLIPSGRRQGAMDNE